MSKRVVEKRFLNDPVEENDTHSHSPLPSLPSTKTARKPEIQAVCNVLKPFQVVTMLVDLFAQMKAVSRLFVCFVNHKWFHLCLSSLLKS